MADGHFALAQMEPRRACQECNRKKTKCDMRRPVCGLCSRTGSPCTFPSRRKKPTSRKPQLKAPSRQIHDSLTKLVEVLEAATRSDAGGNLSNTQQETTQSLLRESLRGLLAELSPTQGTTSSAGDDLDPRASHDHNESEDGNDHEVDHDETDHEPASLADDRSVPEPIAASRMSSEETCAELEVTDSLAIDLVNLFFEKVQAWLPLLHRPRFHARFEHHFLAQGDLMKDLTKDDALLLNGMFALSARFSNHPKFSKIPPLKRGHIFAERARQLYDSARSSSLPSLTNLQGCILLSYYYYTSGPTPRGWILIGVCVRLAYDLGLSDIDDDDWAPSSPLRTLDKEELRRAWWLVWELDTFASSVSRKPFSIDRKRMAVRLPISDEAWFSGNELSSRELVMTPGQSWRSLEQCENQDERAWFLVSNHLMTMIHDRLQQRQEVSFEEKLTLENEITCFKLALPPTLRLDPELLVFTPETFAKCNWVIGTHLMLMTTSYMSAGLSTNESDDRSMSSGSTGNSSPLRQRAIDLSRIIGLWDARYIALAHPFLTCMLLPINAFESDILKAQPLVATTHNLSKLVLKHVGEKWRLGLVVSEIAKMLERPGNLTAQEKQLAKRYKAFFQSPQFGVNSPGQPLPSFYNQDRVKDFADPSLYLNDFRSMQQPHQNQEDYTGSIPSSDGIPITNYPLYGSQVFPTLAFNAFDVQSDTDFGFSDFFGGYPDGNADFNKLQGQLNPNIASN